MRLLKFSEKRYVFFGGEKPFRLKSNFLDVMRRSIDHNLFLRVRQRGLQIAAHHQSISKSQHWFWRPDYGRISYHEAEKRSGEWTPSKGIEDNLYDKWQSAPNVELLIHEHRETGKTQHHVVVKDNQNNSIVQFLYGIAAKGISHLPFRQDRAHSPPIDWLYLRTVNSLFSFRLAVKFFTGV